MCRVFSVGGPLATSHHHRSRSDTQHSAECYCACAACMLTALGIAINMLSRARVQKMHIKSVTASRLCRRFCARVMTQRNLHHKECAVDCIYYIIHIIPTVYYRIVDKKISHHPLHHHTQHRTQNTATPKPPPPSHVSARIIHMPHIRRKAHTSAPAHQSKFTLLLSAGAHAIPKTTTPSDHAPPTREQLTEKIRAQSAAAT